MNVWKSWAECNGLNDEIVKYDTKELDECLSRFFAEIRESDGSDSEPDSLRVMLAQTKWQQNIHSKGPRICRMQTGPRGQELFAKKATDNDQMQQKHFSIVQDEEQLWKNRVIGEQNPKSLLHTLWCLLTLHFGLRGRQEHHEMFVEDFSLNRDAQGTE